MKSKISTCITAMALFAALAVPLGLVAQERQQKEHTRYELIDIGTFGGPNNSVPTSFLSRDSLVGRDPECGLTDTSDTLFMGNTAN